MRETLSKLLGMANKNEREEKINRDEIHQLPVSDIVPNKYQPRTIFNDERIDELALTIQTHGLIQPIVVRKCETGYEIIAGERRFRAISKLGWETVPAIMKEMNDVETASVALIENLQREELTVIEEAIAYQQLLDLHQLTQEALAQRLGKGQSTVANKLRLLKLPQNSQQLLCERKITERHARALLTLKQDEQQQKVVQIILEKQLNVKQTEQYITTILDMKVIKPKRKQKSFSRDTRIAINTIKESIQLIQKTGMSIDTKEQELDECYQFTITIPKK